MSDADGRKIPLVEDDQGEGIKDFIDEPIDLNQVIREIKKVRPEPMKNDNPSMLELLYNQHNIILEKLAKIEQAIGNHVLINGRWVEIKKD